MTDTITISLTVFGRVQGVGFRDFTQKTAISLGLKGWVRNSMEANVEIVAQGSEDKISAFIDRLHVGPRNSYVERVENKKAEADSFTAFEIRF